MPNNRKANVVILGAGLAGLAAGHALSRNGRDILVIERDSGVGGLAKTVHHAGFRFDIGGHRFKTTNPSIENLVTELMGGELLQVKRSSKILLRGKYFDYPLKPLNAFFGFGIPTATRILTDYLLERFLRARKNVPLISLQDWVVHNFGRTLFDIYFREYSEKIWGLDCQEICMEWVQQRIQGLSLGLAIKHALYKSAGGHLRTLANTFLYPPLGIGRIAEKFAAEIRRKNDILTSSRIT
ncbi:MAG TPA: FAD-binding protein, partial [Acidiferrobacteraceae bacterium]|nr:FAD-binding protein [Acidiferrobacteraceae bacterium]HEX20664.1 FAD-binding protein [Acidiferrobacteraceae bacterium]